MKDQKTLRYLKEGGKVNFRLENSGQDLVVVQISKAARGPPIRATPATLPEAQMQSSDKKLL